ncbi:MAG: cytochrome-c oxidase [Mesorhizobium sp.]|nr:cytochrome-c oxidase [Mesorhizobium sp. M5C.F.Ca.IN.020.29.1.1]RWD44031.1 MAG: cytochrome-c oxidase [Mesorhizobium sp.]RWE61392.1 MAG: cytochrome-c oxidase [Mesorhizobium sp.]RWF10834.1 MAG: cytochrome-c oxidase [Mesorhizobium sp.]RWF20239.1 MAG: cytochrome-c oxidase [Mesorhizobium sp.]
MGLRHRRSAARRSDETRPDPVPGLCDAAALGSQLHRRDLHRDARIIPDGVYPVRRACLILGLLVLALVWVGPLLDAWRDSFSAHMLAHMGVVAIAAPLMAIGIPLRPKPDANRAFTLALPASLVELIIVWSWHAPALRTLAQSSLFATAIEQAMFLAAGLFLWLTCLPRRGSDITGNAAGAFALLLTSIHMTLLGALLALTPRPLYGTGEISCFGVALSAQQDQELGGVIMLLVGAAVYLAGGVTLFARLLAAPPRKAV